MNEIIRNIEAAQLKENAPEFNVGDTVKVYGKIELLKRTCRKESKSKRISKIVNVERGTNTHVLVPFYLKINKSRRYILLSI